LTSMVISSPERRTTVAMIAPRLIIYRGLEHTPRNNILSRPHPTRLWLRGRFQAPRLAVAFNTRRARSRHPFTHQRIQRLLIFRTKRGAPTRAAKHQGLSTAFVVPMNPAHQRLSMAFAAARNQTRALLRLSQFIQRQKALTRARVSAAQRQLSEVRRSLLPFGKMSRPGRLFTKEEPSVIPRARDARSAHRRSQSGLLKR
ncbi:hypothetical protein CKO36_19245, partial [Rhabdochromatium marinum]|nr:hypothetical protein [Rhabdochromatium marinum]